MVRSQILLGTKKLVMCTYIVVVVVVVIVDTMGYLGGSHSPDYSPMRSREWSLPHSLVAVGW